MTARARILYIDDDAGLRRLAERALTRRGYEVTLAERGADGVSLASSASFEVIAVDHYMPEMDGLETLRRLQRLPSAAPVVYVTGSEEGQIAIAALKAGAADYVVKTVGDDFFDLLCASFEQVIERAALAQAKEQAEAGLRASNARLEALLREVNHRVANSLQLVSALVSLQSNALTDEGARAALTDTQRRIAAIAQVHRRLYTTDDVASVDMQEYLGALVGELAETWSSNCAPRSVTLNSESVRLPTDRAVSLGVIVNELVSNACKYAYSEDGPGEVRVALHRDGDDGFLLIVEDDGVGIPKDQPPRGTGIGTRVIRAMAQSLQSTIEFDPTHSGVRAVLKASLT